MAALDGIRGLAIAVVFLHHIRQSIGASDPVSKAIGFLIYQGWAGVDLFFVLSGFLITGILLDTREADNYFESFYARRVLRIFPLYYVFLAVAFTLFPLVTDAARLPAPADHWLYYCYLTNWLGLWKGPWGAIILGHLWSLAVEEQFYFCWPLLVWVLKPRHLLWVLAAGEAAVIGGRTWWVLGHGYSDAVSYATVTRMDGLLVGAICAVAARRVVLPERVVRRLPWLALAGLGLDLAGQFAAAHWRSSGLFDGYFAFPLLAGSFGCLVLYAALTDGARSGLQAVLSWKPLTNTGKVAYGLYVFHVPLLRFAEQVFHSVMPLWVLRAVWFGYLQIPALWLLCYFAARLSFDHFEQRFLNWKDRFKARYKEVAVEA